MPLKTQNNPLLPRLPESEEDQGRFNEDLLEYLRRQSGELRSDLDTATSDIYEIAYYREEVTKHTSVSGATNISFETGIHIIELSGSATVTFTNLPSEDAGSVVLIIDHGSGGDTITWDDTILWAGSSAASQTEDANSVDIITILYVDSTFYGFPSGLDFGEDS